MVKTIISIIITACLIIFAAIFENFFVSRSFSKIETAVLTLQEKTEEKTATRNDALIVKTLWDTEKKKLHIVVPHNDISYVDYWLGEAISLVETQNYDDALSRIEVLYTICKQIPQTYKISFENVF